MKLKNGQAWGFDLIIGLTIFLGAVIVFYFYAMNYSGGEADSFQEMQDEGEIIADSLLSEGSPLNWNSGNVIVIGLLTDDKINETKLGRFADLDYERTKELFNAKYDYYVNFSKPLVVNEVTLYGIGQVNLNAENVVHILRVSSYKNEPITLSIYLSD